MKRGLVVAMVMQAALACSPANVASAPVDAGAGATLDASPGSGDAGITLARACADGAFARCSRLQTCSASALQFRYGDLHTCETLFQDSCLEINTAPSTGTTTATIEACAQAISGPSWSCGDYLVNQNPPPACSRQSGSLPNGSPCGLGQQCQSAFCSIAAGQMCGTCAAAPQPGDSCANLTDCGPVLNCIPASQKCEGYALIGGACSPGLPCAVGLACVGYNVQSDTTGTCQPESTTADAGCSFQGAGCDVFAGLSCNAQTQTCGTALVVGAGAACGLVANQEAYCAAAGTCVEGACQASAGVGEPCDVANGPSCITLARCVLGGDGGTSGTCRIPSASTCK
jgi:hypothetical protein